MKSQNAFLISFITGLLGGAAMCGWQSTNAAVNVKQGNGLLIIYGATIIIGLLLLKKLSAYQNYRQRVEYGTLTGTFAATVFMLYGILFTPLAPNKTPLNQLMLFGLAVAVAFIISLLFSIFIQKRRSFV